MHPARKVAEAKGGLGPVGDGRIHEPQRRIIDVDSADIKTRFDGRNLEPKAKGGIGVASEIDLPGHECTHGNVVSGVGARAAIADAGAITFPIAGMRAFATEGGVDILPGRR